MSAISSCFIHDTNYLQSSHNNCSRSQNDLALAVVNLLVREKKHRQALELYMEYHEIVH